jgi:hypothetical protein
MSKFHLGQTVITPGALNALLRQGESPAKFLARHAKGDWGDVCAEDKAFNDEALITGTRLMSAYTTTNGTKIWIITEADRSVTTLLLPEEY